MEHSNYPLDQAWAALLVETMKNWGVKDVCIAPGSRSTPLTIAVAQESVFTTHVHIDERGLCFFALGLAKGGRRPVAVITTSGTAVANLLPAVIEASYSHVPLIILTADRPPELLNCGANQAINQHHIYGSFVRYFLPLLCPTSDLAPDVFLQRLGLAFQKAVFPIPGPVHINCPFREPFGMAEPVSWGDDPYLSMARIPAANPPASRVFKGDKSRLISWLSEFKKGLVIVGEILSLEHAKLIWLMIHHLKWPVIADVTSQLRLSQSPYLVPSDDATLKCLSDHGVDGILHIGGRLTSKALNAWILKKARPYLQLYPYDSTQDPLHVVTEIFQGELGIFADWISGNDWSDNPLLGSLSSVERKEPSLTFEESVVKTVLRYLPESGFLFCGNSLPIRHINLHAEPRFTLPYPTYVNRGASGIDGLLATAAGVSSASSAPGTILIGDLSFIHDVNSLLLLKSLHVPLRVVVINNDGGAIFSHLPIASSFSQFEKFFKTPHGLRFSSVAEWVSLPYQHVSDLNALSSVLSARPTCSEIIEVSCV